MVLVHLSVMLNSEKGFTEKVKEIEVIEHSKCYDTKDKSSKKRRYRKDSINKITSNLKNTIDGDSKGALIGYSTITTKERVGVMKDELYYKIDEHVSKIFYTSQKLMNIVKN